jgi:predicted dienelactone hydrolase
VPAQRPSSTTKGIRHIDPVVWYPLLPGVAHPHCRFPLIIISHGVNGKPTSYAYLAARLASEGFVVIGPHHGDQRSGGDEALERLKDMTFLLADLRSIADRVAPGLARRIDRRRIGVIGHSFGAHTVAQLAARDPQVKAAMIMAGGGDPATAASIHAPTLVVTSPDDRLVPVSFMERFFRSLPRSTPRGLMLIAGVPHTGFSRNCAASHACGILQRAATALFLTYLDDRRGAAGPIDPARPHSPRVSLTTDGMPPGRTH